MTRSSGDRYPVTGRGWVALSVSVDGYQHLRRLQSSVLTRQRRQRLGGLVAWSLECLELWWSHMEGPGYIAYSGGKDSAVLLHLARSLRPDTEAGLILEREGALPCVHEAAAELRERGVVVHEVVWGSLIESIQGTGRAVMDLGVVRRWAREAGGFHGAARGLRAEESKARTMHAWTHHPVRHVVEGWWEADPILWWTAEDIWAYHALHGIPYGDVYDADSATPRNRRRIGTPWGILHANYGRLEELQRLHPEQYRSLKMAVPEIREIAGG